MAADSKIRRALKQLLHRSLNQHSYRALQAIAKAWDILRGNWSEPELDLIPLGVRGGDAVLDVGANYGLYSYHLSRAVGRRGRVFAFEPVPATCATLRLVRRLLGFRNVEIIDKGCADETGKIVFEVPLQSSGAISAGQAFIARRNDDHPGKETQVRWSATEGVLCDVVRLDDVLPDLPELSFIKCDVEGAELFAFRGGRETISRHLPTVVCEINPWYLDGFGVRLDELTSFFFDLGYQLYRYTENGARKKLLRVSEKDIVEDNYVFLHPHRQHAFAALFDDAP